MSFTVNPEDVVTSAVSVTGHGDQLAASHSQSDGRMTTAANGWAGRSAAALAARTDKWLTTTSTIVGNIGTHAESLHVAASSYIRVESNNERLVKAVYAAEQPPGTNPVDL